MDDRQKISVVLGSAELQRFNSYCAEKAYKKSTLIKRLIREHLDREHYQAPTEIQAQPPPHHVVTRQTRRPRRKAG